MPDTLVGQGIDHRGDILRSFADGNRALEDGLRRQVSISSQTSAAYRPLRFHPSHTLFLLGLLRFTPRAYRVSGGLVRNTLYFSRSLKSHLGAEVRAESRPSRKVEVRAISVFQALRRMLRGLHHVINSLLRSSSLLRIGGPRSTVHRRVRPPAHTRDSLLQRTNRKVSSCCIVSSKFRRCLQKFC